MEISQKTYLSIGIGEKMSAADIFTAEIDENDEIVLKDTYSTGYRAPKIDDSQDLKLLGILNTYTLNFLKYFNNI